MDLNFQVFQEPRGIMRLLHFVFSIFAFATVTGYSGYEKFECKDGFESFFHYDYPFALHYNESLCGPKSSQYVIIGDFSGDAKFFVATGVLALIYTLAIIFVYLKFDTLYRQNPRVPLGDFIVTVVLGVFWLSSSAAWANGLTGLKYVTDVTSFENPCGCVITSSSFSSLNISVILGFLNFFLWAADLWFLYKETSWFQGNKFHTTSGV
ncbi:hypothetical protein WA026_010455 [Henosepilachna vigintioctopunctata]|uniref:MARVEL domain-containing protein n=1 Tax=Henosepilachna vigintioctopunctata TaxID=420089 RepID=A0AAW1VE41_9CUCU